MIIVRNDERLLTAVWSDVNIMFWRGSTDDELLDKVEQDLPTTREMQAGDYVFLLLIVGGNRTRPSPAVRERLNKIIDTDNRRLKAIARVFEDGGFRGSISRGIATSTDPPSASYSRKSFGNIGDAAKWLANVLGRQEDWAHTLTSNVTEQRKLLSAA